jgi:transposase
MDLMLQKLLKKIGISTATGYLWQDQRNKNGYEGLIHKYAGVRPPKLSAED